MYDAFFAANTLFALFFSSFLSNMRGIFQNKRDWILLVLALVLAAAGVWAWQHWAKADGAGAFVSSNGRIEATEIDIATKLAGRVQEVLVEDGAFVQAGQVVATMQVDSLEAQLREAQAQSLQADTAVASAQAQVAMRRSDKVALEAQVRSAQSNVDAARKRLQRSEALRQKGAVSGQMLDDDRASLLSAEAVLAAQQAQVHSAEAAITAAQAQVRSAETQKLALAAALDRIQIEIEDSQLKAPRDGRVQYRLAQPGEVLGAGGRVLSLLDMGDVYMSFFLPTELAGQVHMGAEVRLVLDAMPSVVIPAKVSFVASAAQFTPKSVETASERQKLMFRVRAQIAPDLLNKHLTSVKSGLPGEAWLRLDESQDWPAHLALKAQP